MLCRYASRPLPRIYFNHLGSLVLLSLSCQMLEIYSDFRRKRLQHRISSWKTYARRQNLPNLRRNGSNTENDHRARSSQCCQELLDRKCASFLPVSTRKMQWTTKLWRCWGIYSLCFQCYITMRYEHFNVLGYFIRYVPKMVLISL